MNTKVMHRTLKASEAGETTFPHVVAALANAGVESYFADLIRHVDTFYLANGKTHGEPMNIPPVMIPESFSQSGVVAAIRSAQADEIRYPEFLKRAMAAGTSAYWCFITGRKVIYFGRNGEFHVEEFPKS